MEVISAIYLVKKEKKQNNKLLTLLIEHLFFANKKDADLIDLYFKRSTRYPQPIKDCLQMAEDLEFKQKTNSPYYWGRMFNRHTGNCENNS